jgi:hypothetical protein
VLAAGDLFQILSLSSCPISWFRLCLLHIVNPLAYRNTIATNFVDAGKRAWTPADKTIAETLGYPSGMQIAADLHGLRLTSHSGTECGIGRGEFKVKLAATIELYAYVEIILMPLRYHGLTHARVLGGLAVHAAPAWMGLSGAGPIALTSFRALDPPTRERRAPEGAAPVDFSLRDMPRRYKHLFVYPGDRPAT